MQARKRSEDKLNWRRFIKEREEKNLFLSNHDINFI